MKLSFDAQLADNYTSQPQKIRVLTEAWVDKVVFCPNCGNIPMDKYPNNQPVADFFCSNCKEDFELKSKRDKVGSKIVNGAYRTMIERLQSSSNPNFFFLNYDLKTFEVLNFLVIPKQFFVPDIIEKRKPLSHTAKRSGWTGCNILLNHIPQIGKIFFVRERKIESKRQVLSNWKKTLFLRNETKLDAKGWLLDTMLCVDKIGRKEFSLDEMYTFENELRKKHPNNRHIKDKLRQQLQILRDKGYIDFAGRGNYRLK